MKMGNQAQKQAEKHDTNYTIGISDSVKWQYQEGTVDEVQINCANGGKIMVT